MDVEVRRGLYRESVLRDAVQQDQTIYLCASERDAKRVTRLELTATANLGDQWRDKDFEVLRGAWVTILPRNDEPSRQQAHEVARGLSGIATEVRILELDGLPPQGTVCDWIEQRNDDKAPAEVRATLEDRASKAPLWIDHSGPQGAIEGHPENSALYASSGTLWKARCLADVEAEEVEFLWRPYIPLRKITVLEGDPGEGKSTIMAALATSGSLGTGLPGMEPFEPFRTLLFSTEDRLADTLRPRLDRQGAECRWIFAHDQPLDFSTDEALVEFEREIARLEPRLVVIDPIVAYLGGRVDTYRANAVRSVLAPLADLAEKHGCAVVIVRHLTKTRAGRSIHAGQGSVDFVAAARSVLLAGSASDDRDRHALVHTKSNLAKPGPSLEYEIQEGRFLWVGETPLTARDLLAAEAPGQEASALEEAEKFLADLLAAAPLPANDVFVAAKQAGISERTIKRAKRNAGIVTKREGFGKGSYVLWSLSNHRGPDDSIEGQENLSAPNADAAPLYGTDHEETERGNQPDTTDPAGLRDDES